MKKTERRRPATRNTKAESASPRRRSPWLLMFFCGLLLLVGFFFAARQHFFSMDFGMKNSQLRKQIKDLESEKRRLIVARESTLSPSEIKKAAKRTGLVDPAAEVQIAPVLAAAKPAQVPDKAVPIKPSVVKTASVASVATVKVPSVFAKAARSDKSAPKPVLAE